MVGGLPVRLRAVLACAGVGTICAAYLRLVQVSMHMSSNVRHVMSVVRRARPNDTHAMRTVYAAGRASPHT